MNVILRCRIAYIQDEKIFCGVSIWQEATHDSQYAGIRETGNLIRETGNLIRETGNRVLWITSSWPFVTPGTQIRDSGNRLLVTPGTQIRDSGNLFDPLRRILSFYSKVLRIFQSRVTTLTDSITKLTLGALVDNLPIIRSSRYHPKGPLRGQIDTRKGA